MPVVNKETSIEWEESDQCGAGPATTREEVFIWACRWHDLQYVYHKKSAVVPRSAIDKQFLDYMLVIAIRKNSRLLKIKAYVYYGIVRALGWVPWMNKSNSLRMHNEENAD